MASFTAGTTFSDGVANDVTAAKLGALITGATPTSGFIQDRTLETITATNDTLLIGDASDSNNLKRITVANFAQTLPTAKVTTGTIDTATLGTTTGTAAAFTSATLGTTTGTAATFTSATLGTTNSTAGSVTTGTIVNGTFGTTSGTAATFTSGTFTTGVIPTGTFGTTTSTAATITTGTIPTLVATTLVTAGTGTAAAPAIVPTGDTNTGFFFPAADTIAVSTNGTERLRIDSSGFTTSSQGFRVLGVTDPNNQGFRTNGSGDTYIQQIAGYSNSLIFNRFDGSTWIESVRINSGGDVILSSTGRLGYGTGSGGTVTQTTNKSTAVTLNKPTGQITMSTATLANGASVSFALNNSLISAVDVLAVNATSFGGYTATCVNTATGAATIRVTNISGGSLSEAVTLQFAVIKGATT